MSVKCESTPPSAIQKCKIQQKTTSIEEKLHVRGPSEKRERTVDIWHNVRFAHSSIQTVCDNADSIKEVLSQELKCLCSNTTTVLSQ